MATPVPATLPEEGAISLSAQDGVLILKLAPEAQFETLRRELRATFTKTTDRFRGWDARLDLDTRPLDLFDLRRLVHLLRDEFGVNVIALYCTIENLHRYAERELKLKVYPIEPEPAAPAAVAEPEPEPAPKPAAIEPAPAQPAVVEPAPQPAVELDGARLKTISRPLRSGQTVRFNGDVVIFGDVNPGAEVIAAGNILVFGALKGLAHAGARGDEGAVIVSFDFKPTQLRIGKKLAIPPRGRGQTRGRVWSPEVAWVQRDQIVIEPYQGRLPQ